MIHDNVKNIEKYFGLGENIKKGLMALKEHGPLEVGKYVLDGDKLFCKVQSYVSKTDEKPLLENHRKYIDIQYVESGVERAEIGPLCEKCRAKDYNEEKDVEFFNPPKRNAEIILNEGDFFIVFPGEAHCAGLSKDEDVQVKKVVVKVLY